MGGPGKSSHANKLQNAGGNAKDYIVQKDGATPGCMLKC
jgi:hypothetical protein